MRSPAGRPGTASAKARSAASVDLFRAVGHTVRALRLGHHLTLDELSVRSGVSRRMIAMLETGESNASLGTLDKLAQALGCEFADLVVQRPAERRTPASATEAPPVWEDNRGSSARLLGSSTRAGTTELWQWRLAPDARYEAEADPTGSEEVILVTTGHLVVEVNAATGSDAPSSHHALRAGDYLRLLTDAPFAYVNSARRSTSFVCVAFIPRSGAGHVES